MQINEDSGPNLLGEEGVQVDPKKGIRSPVIKGTPRGTLQKIPQRVLTDLRRRIAEVKFAEAVIKAGGKMDPDAAIKEASKKKYGGLIDSTRINKIHADPNKFIKQLGVDPTNLKTGEKLPSVSDLRRYVRNSLDNVEAQVGRLNKHLFPEGVPLDHIVRSIHFGHGQALGSAGPHVGDEGLAQLPMENIGQGKLSGPSKGELDLATGRYKVNDAYSAIGHPQFWDEVLSNFIMGRKHVPVLVELTPEGKNRVIHQGHDPDRVIIEEGEIKLRDAVTGEPKVRVDPASEADPLHDYSKHQQKVLKSSQKRALKPQDQQIVEHKPTSTMQDTKMLKEWMKDQDVDGRYKPQVTEVGRRLGGLTSKINLPGPWDLGANVIGPLAVAASTQDYSNVVPEVAKNIADEVEFGLKAGVVAATPLGQTVIKGATAAFAAVPAKPVVGAVGLLAAENRGTATDEAMQQFADDLHYSAGGGNAAMVKHGWSIEETREQGHKNLMKQWLETPVN